MDLMILISIAVGILTILIGFLLFLKSRPSTKEDVIEPPAGPGPRLVRPGAPRRAQMARNRGARMRAAAAVQDEGGTDDEHEDGAEGAGDQAEDIEFPDTKVGAKKRAKMEAKAEKKAQREQAEHMREERRKKADVEEMERRKCEELEQLEEKRREEAENQAREEKERREHEEYLKMKAAFAVEEEGFEEGETNEENLLQEFVRYIKEQKVVVIEDLASRFKLKTQAAIDRIKELQNDEIITGVIDDRGKFIYVSPQEMEAVAKFIRQRGRVSIVELAENSNQLINLNTSAVR